MACEPARAPSALRLIHLSDPHLTSVGRPGWPMLFNKRASGCLTWWGRRRHLHRPDVLKALIDDIRSVGYDHVALTGDLTQLGLPAECRQALDWLQALGPPERVSVVPGNHDAYVPAPWSQTIGLWHAYMSEDAGQNETGQAGGEVFPFVRYRDGVALIGVSTALPTPWPLATGTLGERQLARLEACLRQTAAKGCFRVLMIHHPPVAGMVGWRKRLTDNAALAGIIRRAGVELMLHGHAHRALDARLPTPTGQALALGTPSASMLPGRGHDHAGYSIIDITRHADATRAAWTVSLTRRWISDRRGTWYFASDAPSRFDTARPFDTACTNACAHGDESTASFAQMP